MPGTMPLYVPLRGNAAVLVAGAPGAAFVRSLKVAALLHDRLILEDGSWVGVAGPGGSSEWRHPGHPGPNDGRWQSARERMSSEREWSLGVKRSGSPGPHQVVVRSATTLSLRASFEPIRRELPHAYPWIDFGSFDLYPEDKALAKRMAAAEVRDGALKGRFDDPFTRQLVADGATKSLLLAARMGAAVRLDGVHREVVAARVLRGEASAVLGQLALKTVVPDVRNLSWEDVDQARRLKGMPRLRAILAEVEAAALERAASGGALEPAILREFHAQYSKAADEGGWSPHARGFAIGAAISLATSPLPLPVGPAAAIALTAVTEGALYLRNQRRSRRLDDGRCAARRYPRQLIRRAHLRSY